MPPSSYAYIEPNAWKVQRAESIREVSLFAGKESILPQIPGIERKKFIAALSF
jgi:hypothetical protein